MKKIIEKCVFCGEVNQDFTEQGACTSVGTMPVNIYFLGYSTGETFKGYEYPYFDKKVADNILNYYEDNVSEILSVYDAAKDRYIFIFHSMLPEPDIKLSYSYEGTQKLKENIRLMTTQELIDKYSADVAERTELLLGDKVIFAYPIGSGSWGWSKDDKRSVIPAQLYTVKDGALKEKVIHENEIIFSGFITGDKIKNTCETVLFEKNEMDKIVETFNKGTNQIAFYPNKERVRPLQARG